MLKIPAELNRNAKSVQDMGEPADTGAMLIDYMCARIGIDDLAGLDVLDLGCGVRFSESILNRDTPIGTYTGIEVKKKIVDFLIEHVRDPRLSYFHADLKNLCYNPRGTADYADLSEVLNHKRYDIACMFSVITHQQPDEASATFQFLNRHIKPDGHMFFSAFLHEDGPEHKELNPAKPGIKSSFSSGYMEKMLAGSGWSIVSRADPVPNDVPIMWSYLCRPVT